MKNLIVAVCITIVAINSLKAEENQNYMIFDEAHTNGSEWVFHNVKFHNNKVNNAYLTSSSGYIKSPVFSKQVIRATISFQAATVNTDRIMEVVPLDADGSEIEGGKRRFIPTVRQDMAVSEWDAELDVRQIRIGICSGGGGNVQFYSCLVEFAGGGTVALVPSGLENRNVRGNSFVAGWNACAGADAYLVDLYQVERTASSWRNEVMGEDFESAVNTGAASKEIKDIPAAFPSMDGTKVYVPPATNGLVQIGSRDKAGWLVLAGWPAEEGRAVRFRAMRCHSSDEGTVMPLLWTDGIATNGFSSVVLGDEMADYEVPLDSVPAGSFVLLHSTTNRTTASRANGRVWLDSVSIVGGYTAARVGTNVVSEAVRTSSASRKFTRLSRGATYLWRVRSVCGEAVSEPSPFVEVVPEGEMEWSGTAIIMR